MPFLDYGLAWRKYQTGRMHENVQRLKKYDQFHCLLAGNKDHAAMVRHRAAYLPADFLNWLEVCDGGMLFDTTLLSTQSRDAALDMPLTTYGALLDAELRKDRRLSDDWFVFAMAIHSDVFFFDQKKRDGKVYQWDVEELKIHATWATFEDWLTDQIQGAVGLIADGTLEPLGIKLEASRHE